MEELKILQKTYDMMQYAYICLRQFPKSEKFALAGEIKKIMANLLRLIIQANKRYFKKTTLQDIDVELQTLNRMAVEKGDTVNATLGIMERERNRAPRFFWC